MTDNDCDGDHRESILTKEKLYLSVKDKDEDFKNDDKYDNCNNNGDNASSNILAIDLDRLMFLFSIRQSFSLQKRSLFIVLSTNFHCEFWFMKVILVYLLQYSFIKALIFFSITLQLDSLMSL